MQQGLAREREQGAGAGAGAGAAGGEGRTVPASAQASLSASASFWASLSAWAWVSWCLVLLRLAGRLPWVGIRSAPHCHLRIGRTLKRSSGRTGEFSEVAAGRGRASASLARRKLPRGSSDLPASGFAAEISSARDSASVSTISPVSGSASTALVGQPHSPTETATALVRSNRPTASLYTIPGTGSASPLARAPERGAPKPGPRRRSASACRTDKTQWGAAQNLTHRGPKRTHCGRRGKRAPSPRRVMARPEPSNGRPQGDHGVVCVASQ